MSSPLSLIVITAIGAGALVLVAHALTTTATPKTLPVPNPYLSFLPTGAQPGYAHWRALLEERAAQRRLTLPAPQRGITVGEGEPNDTPATATFLAGFGTGKGEQTAIDVRGDFTPPPAPAALGPFAEDEGAIPLASATGLTPGTAVTITGTIGDGPFGSGGTGSGDLDFFRIPGVTTGQLILIDVDTAAVGSSLDTFIGLYDSAGNIVALNEDEEGASNLDSFLAIPAPIDGDYYLSVAGSLFPFASVLSDPFDSSTGFGVGSEGDYAVTIGLEYGDPDWVSFELEACDILGVNLLGAGSHLLLRDPAGALQVASSQDLSALFPEASPLPGGGEAVLAYLATAPGIYRLRALGAGGPGYGLELRLFRQPVSTPAPVKILFVDFDGATVDPAIFGGPPGDTTLSPFATFLPNWGLTAGDEDAVIDAILAALEENVATDPTLLGPSNTFRIEVRNSRDHADPFGAPNVSRLIIGGTIPELGLPTIGIAQSIDPGNFGTAETAVVLLDLLSRPAGEPDSLNTFPLAPGVSIIELLGVAIGNIAAHEAGHYTGSYHTEQSNLTANLMDRGGNLPNTVGVGPDGIFGNADDVDVDFGADMFADSERFAGVEETLTVFACGCAAGDNLFSDGFESGNLGLWSGSVP